MEFGRQTSMTEGELREVFHKFDIDGSGSIDEHELGNAMRVFGIKCSANSCKKVMKQIDANGNGQVEWSEFVEYFSRISDPDEIKDLLSKENQRFFEYKQMVEGDPSFSKTFVVPPIFPHVQRFEAHNGSVEALSWLNDTQFVSGSIDGEVMVWNALNTSKSPRPERVLTCEGALYNLAASRDGQQLLTCMGTKTANLKLWNMAGDETAPALSLAGHEMPVYSCAFSADGTLGASGSKGGMLCLHDLQNPTPQQRWKGHDGVVYSLDFHKTSQAICSASADGTVKIFDTRNFGTKEADNLVIEDAAAAGSVFRALWRKEFEILSCGDDYCIKRWDIRSVRDGPVGSYFGHTAVVRTIVLSPDERFLVSGTQSGSVRVWLADEDGMLEDMRRDIRQAISVLDQKRTGQEELLGSGDLDPQELKDTMAGLATQRLELQRLSSVELRRSILSCTQARLGLNTSALPVSSLGWRDFGGVGCVAVGSQDQTIRTFNLDVAKLATFEPWKKD